MTDAERLAELRAERDDHQYNEDGTERDAYECGTSCPERCICAIANDIRQLERATA